MCTGYAVFAFTRKCARSWSGERQAARRPLVVLAHRSSDSSSCSRCRDRRALGAPPVALLARARHRRDRGRSRLGHRCRARRRADARLFLVSLAFVAAASFLGLHALATPGVLLEGPNTGFVIATPVGLMIASVFALWSAARLDGSRARFVLAHADTLRAGVVVAVLLWGVWSLASLPGLDDSVPPETGSPGLWTLAVPGDRPVRDRSRAVRRPRPRAPFAPRARGRGLVGAAGRSDARGHAGPQLAGDVVGVAPPDARGVRRGRPRRPAQPGLGALRRPLPRRGRRRGSAR